MSSVYAVNDLLSGVKDVIEGVNLNDCNSLKKTKIYDTSLNSIYKFMWQDII